MFIGSKNCPHLESDTAYGKIFAVLQHAQVFCYQSSTVHQTLCSLRVVVPLWVFPSHILEPSQPKVWRCLVSLCNPISDTETRSVWILQLQPIAKASILLKFYEVYLYMRSTSISGSSWCSFIFTVSDRIMCRLNTRSWTCEEKDYFHNKRVLEH